MFSTRHVMRTGDARELTFIRDGAVDLVVTSPPYPMIAMWDGLFGRLNPAAAAALADGAGAAAFELMHSELDKVWAEVFRVLKEGGLACINIGDAVRSLGGEFGLYPNHARILSACTRLGFQALPCLIWRKQTNAPNKFMGSGMLPAGGYVTLEHEYILVLRRGGRRRFDSEESKLHRRQSAFFWEERNRWFSDIWDFKGARQELAGGGSRERSAAYPFELPFRLIAMHSCLGDTVLDPFLGTGTTACAAIMTGRNSLGVELAPELIDEMMQAIPHQAEFFRNAVRRRVEDHLSFVRLRTAEKGPLRHRNRPHGFPVVTSQETDLTLYEPAALEPAGENTIGATHCRVEGFQLPLL